MPYVSLLLPGTGVDSRAFLLLHGSNGDEHDLVDQAAGIAPRAARLALRGNVAMRPQSALFRRFPARRIDVHDLRCRSARLARFLRLAAERDPSTRTPIALGCSNGAIMALALLLEAPEVLAGAILLRPLLPFEPPPGLALNGRPVLVVDGVDDPRRAPDDVMVAEVLRRAGAVVQHETARSGNAIGPGDVDSARRWSRLLGT